MAARAGVVKNRNLFWRTIFELGQVRKLRRGSHTLIEIPSVSDLCLFEVSDIQRGAQNVKV
jgi:hypothetical protein